MKAWADTEKLKRQAAEEMAAYDKLPPRIRHAIGQTGVNAIDVLRHYEFGYSERELLEMIYAS